LQIAYRIRGLAEKYPQYFPVQSLAIQTLIGVARSDEAVKIATRAVRTFPNSPEAARLAFVALGRAKQWGEALGFARTWRRRSLNHPVEADLGISEAYMMLEQPREAVKTLEPYVADALKTPDTQAPVLLAYIRALASAGEKDEVEKLIGPLIEKGAVWKQVWIDFAVGYLPESRAVEELKKYSAALKPEALDQLAYQAEKWYELSSRYNKPEYAQTAAKLYRTLAESPGATARAILVAAMSAERNALKDDAEALYRRALKLDATLAVAQNNLAMILAERGGNLKEAADLAEAAVRQQPNVATFHDTLATVQGRAKNYPAAITSARAALAIDVYNIGYRVNLIQLLVDGGFQSEAVLELKEVDRIRLRVEKAPDPVRKQYESLRAKLIPAEGGAASLP
jgi:tetratricopeptide (TPR) repeat protein